MSRWDMASRSLKDSIALVKELEKCKVRLRSLQENIPTSGGESVFHLFDALVGFEPQHVSRTHASRTTCRKSMRAERGLTVEVAPQQIE